MKRTPSKKPSKPKKYLYLGNRPFPPFDHQPSIEVIGSNQELTARMKGPAPDGIIIQVELDWVKAIYSKYKGFNYLELLRIELGYKGPIILSSYHYSEETPIPSHFSGTQYLKDSAVRLVSQFKLETLDFCPKNLPWDAPLTDSAYEFLREHLYDEHQYFIDLLTHDLNNIIVDTSLADTTKRKRFQEFFLRLKFQFPEITTDFSRYEEAFYRIWAKDKKGAFEAFEPLVQQIRKEHIQSNHNGTTFLEPSSKLKVLWLDPKPIPELRDFLVNRGVDIVTCATLEAALEELLLDELNDIRVLICAAVFKDDLERYAPLQGVEAWRAIKNSKHIHTLIPLTGVDKYQLNEMVREAGYRFRPFLKQDLMDEEGKGFEKFFQLLVEENTWVMNFKLPPQRWKNHWRINYRWHREADDFKEYEEYLVAEAKKWVNRVCNSSSSTVLDWPSDTFLFRPSTEPTEENLEKFRLQLLYRRIALGLLLFRGDLSGNFSTDDTWDVICNILRTGRIALPKDANKKDVVYKLQLKRRSLNPYSQDLTREEEKWLREFQEEPNLQGLND